MTWEPPDEFDTINLAGTIFFISRNTRLKVEEWMRWKNPQPYDTLIVETLVGELLTIVRDGVNTIYSSTPETRQRDQELTKLLKGEYDRGWD